METATRRTGLAGVEEWAAAAVTRAETALKFAKSVEARAGVAAILGGWLVDSDGVVIAELIMLGDGCNCCSLVFTGVNIGASADYVLQLTFRQVNRAKEGVSLKAILILIAA